MANENVLQAPEGAKDTVIVLDMTRQRFGGGISGFVPEGHYAAELKDAEVVKQKSKEGKNLHLTWETVAPDGFEGVRIETYHPIPVGDPTSTDYQTRENNLLSLVASYASGLGKLEEIRQRKDAKLTPAWLLQPNEDGSAKRFFFLTGEGNYKGRAVAEVAFYIAASEFAESPGPKKGANPVAASSGASASGGGTPDLMGGGSSSSSSADGGNGTQAGAPASGSAAVDKALGL